MDKDGTMQREKSSANRQGTLTSSMLVGMAPSVRYVAKDERILEVLERADRPTAPILFILWVIPPPPPTTVVLHSVSKPYRYSILISLG